MSCSALGHESTVTSRPCETPRKGGGAPSVCEVRGRAAAEGATAACAVRDDPGGTRLYLCVCHATANKHSGAVRPDAKEMCGHVTQGQRHAAPSLSFPFF